MADFLSIRGKEHTFLSSTQQKQTIWVLFIHITGHTLTMRRKWKTEVIKRQSRTWRRLKNRISSIDAPFHRTISKRFTTLMMMMTTQVSRQRQCLVFKVFKSRKPTAIVLDNHKAIFGKSNKIDTAPFIQLFCLAYFLVRPTR